MKKLICAFALAILTILGVKTVPAAYAHESNNINIPCGKTFYLQKTSSYDSLTFESFDNSIAKIYNNGFIYATCEGTTTINIYNKDHNIVDTYTVNITEPEPIKFTYSSPNNIKVGQQLKLTAITDKSTTSVKFIVDNKEVLGTKEDNSNTFVWTSYITVNNVGNINIKAYSLKNNTWKTCSNGEYSTYVSSESNNEPKKPSDDIINFIAKSEGYASEVYMDQYVYNTPTIGYGKVIWPGESFYNNITQKEAYASLLNSINNKYYTNSINNFLKDNNIQVTQNQFDALLSFSYNNGASWTTDKDSDLRNILLSSYDNKNTTTEDLSVNVTSTNGINIRSGPSTNYNILACASYNETLTLIDSQKQNGNWYHIKTSNGIDGYCCSDFVSLNPSNSTTCALVTSDNGINIRSGPGTDYNILACAGYNETLTVLNDQNNNGNWCHIKTSNGVYGYCCKDYLSLYKSNSRNLNYIDKNAFINEFSAYHHAGGTCINGLLYRRFDELSIFFFGEYERHPYFYNPHNYPIPQCIANRL